MPTPSIGTLRRRARTAAVIVGASLGLAAPAYAGQLQPTTGCAYAPTAKTVSCDLWVEAGSIAVTPPVLASLPSDQQFASLPTLQFRISPAATDPGSVPGIGGPTIVVHEGDDVSITLHNPISGAGAVSLSFPQLAGVLHGGKAGSDRVGVAPSGAPATYTFHAGAPGTYLYQAGPTQSGKQEIALGLSGALVVEATSGAYDYADTRDAFDNEAVVLLQEIDPALNLDTNPGSFDMRTFHARLWLPNAALTGGDNNVAVTSGKPTLVRYLNAGLNDHAMSTLGLQQLRVATNAQPSVNLSASHADQALLETVAMLPPGSTQDAIVSIPIVPTNTQYPLFDDVNDVSIVDAASGSTAVGSGVARYLTVTGGTGTLRTCATDTMAVVASISPYSQTVGGTGMITFSGTAVQCGSATAAASAEYFIDQLGTPGTGTAAPLDGSGNFTTAPFPASPFSADTTPHTVWFDAYNGTAWGPLSSAEFVVDAVGPDVHRLAVEPAVTNAKSGTIHVWATGDELHTGGSNVTRFRWHVGACLSDGGPAGIPVATPLPEVDVQFDVPASCFASLSDGPQLVVVEMEDALLNWTTDTSAASPNDPNGVDVLLDTAPPVLDANGGLVRRPAGPDTLTDSATTKAYPGNTSPVAVQVLQRLPSDPLVSTGVYGGPYTDWNNGTLPWELNTHEFGVRASAKDANEGTTASHITGMYGSSNPSFCTDVNGLPNLDLAARLDPLGGSFGDSATSYAEGFQYVPLSELNQYTNPPVGSGLYDPLTSQPYAADVSVTGYAGIEIAYYVRAVDAAGNWSTCPSVYAPWLGHDPASNTARGTLNGDGLTGSLTIATGGVYAVTSITLPVITAGNRAVRAAGGVHTAMTATIRATVLAVGKGNAVTGAEWFADGDPGAGNGTPFAAAGGSAWMTSRLNVISRVDVVRWAAGRHTISVRVRDMAGNWSKPTSTSVVVAPKAILVLGFEHGLHGLAARGATSASAAAALSGHKGLQVTSGARDAYVAASVAGTDSFRATFLLDLNGSTARGTQTLFAGAGATGDVVAIQRTTSAGKQLIRLVVTDSRGQQVGSWQPLGDGTHAISVAWFAGSSGEAKLGVDGATRTTLRDMHLKGAAIRSIRLGAIGAGRGVIHLDQLVATR